MSDTYSSDSIAAEIIKAPVEEWLSQQYGVYSLYVIRDRALVNLDGLKPVARRLLYSFFIDGITPTSSYVKSARACASVMRFHPHGNSSIEGTAAAMAQWFTNRVTLTDPHGSVGRNHGDQPAAARYLELRLTKAAMELVKEVNEGAVPLGKNFDGTLDEPQVLPVRWPDHIINGSQGIAVGYASSMVAHNPDEVMNALVKLLRNPEMTVEQLLKVMPGPDLPTGGELLGVEGVKDYYETGKGGFSVRGRYSVENLSRGRAKIVFHEIPYQVKIEDLIKKIRELQNAGKFKEIATVKDLSDFDNPMRFAIETKAGTNHLSVLNALFKETDLEKKYSVNNTVLVENVPVLVPMIDMLKNFVEFRKQCTLNKATARIEKIDGRLHQLAALLAVLVDIDKCIAIIRQAESTDEARTGLMAEFSLDASQADHILSMQLRRLTKADSLAIQQENDTLNEEKAALQLLLTENDKLLEAVERDLLDTKKVISDKRRTVINGMSAEELKLSARSAAQTVRDTDKSLPCYVTRFASGKLLRTAEPFTYEAGLKKLDKGPVVEQLKVKTQENIILVASNGIAYNVPLSYLPPDQAVDMSGVGVSFEDAAELVAIGKMTTLKTDIGLLLATEQGEVKLVNPKFPSKEEFPVFSLSEGDRIVSGRWIGRSLTGTAFVSITSAGAVLVYDATVLRAIGAPAGGVKSHKLKDAGDKVIYFGWVQQPKSEKNVIVSQAEGSLKLTALTAIPPKSKGAMGVALHKFGKNDSKLVSAFVGEQPLITLEAGGGLVNKPQLTPRAAAGTPVPPVELLMGGETAPAW